MLDCEQDRTQILQSTDIYTNMKLEECHVVNQPLKCCHWTSIGILCNNREGSIWRPVPVYRQRFT